MRLIAINAERGLLKIYFDASSPSVCDFEISRGAAGGGAHLSRSYTSEVAGGGTVVWGGVSVAKGRWCVSPTTDNCIF